MSWKDRARQAVEKKGGGTVLTKPTKPPFVSSVSEPPATFPESQAWDYTLADLKEIRQLIRDLAQLEEWTDAELAEALDHSQRMAPVNVPTVLQQLRHWVNVGLAPWPEKPARSPKTVFLRLTVIQGGKR